MRADQGRRTERLVLGTVIKPLGPKTGRCKRGPLWRELSQSSRMQAAKPTKARLSVMLTLRQGPVRVEEDEQTDGAVALVIAIRSALAGRL